MLMPNRRIVTVSDETELQNLSPCNAVVIPPSGYDDTALLQAAITAVTASGLAGTVYLTEGVYYVGMLEIPTTGKIAIVGPWSPATRIKRLPGVNTPSVVQTAGFDQLDAAGNYSNQFQGTHVGSNGVYITGVTIDGNRAQNSSGSGIRLYGAGLSLRDVTIEHCNGDALVTGWNGEDNFSDPLYTLEGHHRDLRLRHVGGTGWVNKGPHDTTVFNAQIYDCGLDGWDNQVATGATAINTYGIARRGIWCHGFGCINGSNICGCGGETGALLESGGSVISTGSFAGPVGLHVAVNHVMIHGMIANTTVAALRLSGIGSGRFDLMYGGPNTGIWVDNQQDDNPIRPSEITIFGSDTGGTLFNTRQQPIPLGRVTVAARGAGKYGVYENAPVA